MKYIDSEKLLAEIERRRLSNRYIDTEGYENELLEIITSLQQEQPEGLHFTPLNRLIQKIPSKNWNDTVNNYARKLRDCLIKEGYLKDAKVLQGYISYMNGNNVPMATMDEQEQPEVDLKKVVMIDNIVMNMIGEGYNNGFKTRPFYEEVVRRINARKEQPEGGCSEKPNNLLWEQQKVDLEEEITAYIERHFHIRYDETLEVGNDPLTTHDFEEIARHFYERGRARKLIWHNVAEEVPTNHGADILVACKNKNKEDGIWLYDLIQCWEGKWEPRVNWETPVKWAYVEDLD